MTDAWLSNYSLVKEHYIRFGNLRFPRNCHLAVWLREQRYIYKGNRDWQLTQEQIQLLDDIDITWKYNVNDLIWNEHYKQAKEYYEKHNTLRVPISYICSNGFRLGDWLAKQRKHYRKKQISDEKIKLLDSIGMIWDANLLINTSTPELIIYFYIKKYFTDAIKLLSGDFLKTEIDIYIPSLKIAIEYDGVYFHKDKIMEDEEKGCICKKNNVKLIRIREKGLPSVENCDECFEIGSKNNINELKNIIEQILYKLLNERVECSVKRDYSKIVEFRKNHSNFRWDYIYSILDSIKTSNGEIVINKENGIDKTSGINLYNWISTQRQEYQKGLMTNYHIKKLKALNIDLAPYESSFNFYFDELIKYKKIYNNLDVKINYETVDGIKLGKWLAHQREKYRSGNMKNIHKQRLNKLGIRFNPQKYDEQLKKDLLIEYYNKNGDINVTKNTIYKGVNIFEYLQGKKKKYVKNELIQQEIDFFESIGIIWTKYEFKWNATYQIAKKYYNDNGNLIIPTSFTMGNVNLGSWISHQRQDYKKNKLTQEKINKLNEIDMCWNYFDFKWMQKYLLLCQYFNEFGNINIKADFEYCGEKLGMWLNTQRQAYRGNPNYHITEKRIKNLEKLGMKW